MPWFWMCRFYKAPLESILLSTGVWHCGFLCSVLFCNQITSNIYVSEIPHIYGVCWYPFFHFQKCHFFFYQNCLVCLFKGTCARGEEGMYLVCVLNWTIIMFLEVKLALCGKNLKTLLTLCSVVLLQGTNSGEYTLTCKNSSAFISN